MVTYAPWYTETDAIETEGRLQPYDAAEIYTREEYLELYGDDLDRRWEADLDARAEQEHIDKLRAKFKDELTHIAGYEDLTGPFGYSCVDCALLNFGEALFADKDNYSDDDPMPVYSWDSNDSDDIVRRCGYCGEAIDVLKDVDARRIASDWHSSESALGLLMLSSTGAISFDDPYDVRKEIAEDIRYLRRFNEPGSPMGEREPDDESLAELEALAEYVEHYGPRGPVDGWSSLNW